MKRKGKKNNFCFLFIAMIPIVMIRLDHRILLAHMPPLVSLNLFRLSCSALGLFSCNRLS